MIFQKKTNIIFLALLVAGSSIPAHGMNKKNAWAKQKMQAVREKMYDAYNYTCEKTRALYEKAKEHKNLIIGAVATFGIAGLLYKTNQARLNAVNQANNFQQQANNLQQQLNTANQNLFTANHNLNNVNQANHDLGVHIAEVRLNLERDLNETRLNAFGQINDLQERLDAILQHGRQNDRQEIDQLNQRLNDLAQELWTANERYDFINQNGDIAQLEIDRLTQELNNRIEALQNANVHNQNAQQRINQLNQELERLANLQQEVDRVTQQLNNVNQQTNTLNHELQNVRQENGNYLDRIRAIQQQLNEANKARQDATRQAQTNLERIEGANSSKDKALREANRLKQEVERVKQQLSEANASRQAANLDKDKALQVAKHLEYQLSNVNKNYQRLMRAQQEQIQVPNQEYNQGHAQQSLFEQKRLALNNELNQLGVLFENGQNNLHMVDRINNICNVIDGLTQKVAPEFNYCAQLEGEIYPNQVGQLHHEDNWIKQLGKDCINNVFAIVGEAVQSIKNSLDQNQQHKDITSREIADASIKNIDEDLFTGFSQLQHVFAQLKAIIGVYNGHNFLKVSLDANGLKVIHNTMVSLEGIISEHAFKVSEMVNSDDSVNSCEDYFKVNKNIHITEYACQNYSVLCDIFSGNCIQKQREFIDEYKRLFASIIDRVKNNSIQIIDLTIKSKSQFKSNIYSALKSSGINNIRFSKDNLADLVANLEQQIGVYSVSKVSSFVNNNSNSLPTMSQVLNNHDNQLKQKLKHLDIVWNGNSNFNESMIAESVKSWSAFNNISSFMPSKLWNSQLPKQEDKIVVSELGSQYDSNAFFGELMQQADNNLVDDHSSALPSNNSSVIRNIDKVKQVIDEVKQENDALFKHRYQGKPNSKLPDNANNELLQNQAKINEAAEKGYLPERSKLSHVPNFVVPNNNYGTSLNNNSQPQGTVITNKNASHTQSLENNQSVVSQNIQNNVNNYPTNVSITIEEKPVVLNPEGELEEEMDPSLFEGTIFKK